MAKIKNCKAGEDAEKLDHIYTDDENVNGIASHSGK